MMRISITRSGIAAIGKNTLRAIGRDAIYAAALYWWTKLLPLHFQNIAYRRYNYAARDKRTNAIKAQRRPWPFGEHLEPAVGEVKPLVFSGRSREIALSHPNIRAKAKNFETFQADVIINARAFNFGAGKRIDMRDEVTRTNPNELSAMQRVFATEFNNKLVEKGAAAPKRTRRTAA
jgi:hypothetical protein